MNVRPITPDDFPALAAFLAEDECDTTRATLDVDSENATGAVALYERVGMHVDTCGVTFEKALE